jgi:purine-nucleoside phosphorylase
MVASPAMSTLDDVLAAAAFVGSRTAAVAPEVGVVLGSGLGTWADALEDRLAIPYADVPNMPVSKVVGHAGNLVLGRVGATRVACLQGRVHVYEGHSMDRAVFGARLLAKLGCKAVLLTNAAGGIRRGFAPGDLMLVTDHLNLMGTNPLSGPNDDRLGPRFPDMTEAYARWIRDAALGAARASGVHLHAGVYAALLGPSYETPAEIHMLRTLGADAVGMSTVPEIIALRHMGIPAGAVSCISNLAAGLSPHALDHSEVEATARGSREAFVAFLTRWVVDVGGLGAPRSQGIQPS